MAEHHCRLAPDAFKKGPGGFRASGRQTGVQQRRLLCSLSLMAEVLSVLQSTRKCHRACRQGTGDAQGEGGLLDSHPPTLPSNTQDTSRGVSLSERAGEELTGFYCCLPPCSLGPLVSSPPPLMGRIETCLPRHPANRQHLFNNEARQPSAPMHPKKHPTPMGGGGGCLDTHPHRISKVTNPRRPVGRTLSTSLCRTQKAPLPPAARVWCTRFGT